MKYSIPVIQHKLKKADGKIVNLCILINSIYYFLEYVFIIKKGNNFQLIVMHRGRTLLNKTYGSAKSAKVAFSNMYRHKVWKPGTKPDWSHFYNPDNKWFHERTKKIA
ncbi:MAG: hypothetical protein L0Y73_02650 [Candidatus Aminicenantes bacterium]|nr:hypothetical protein [Candidatus Aminicenantes bacterium]